MQWLIDMVLESLEGIIVEWSGAIVDIPSGWSLCDGSNGTPDLRNRFVVGAGDTYAPDATGGNSNHNHGYVGAGHTHGIESGAEIAAGIGYAAITNSDFSAGTTNDADGKPPYYALAYIMKT